MATAYASWLVADLDHALQVTQRTPDNGHFRRAAHATNIYLGHNWHLAAEISVGDHLLQGLL